MAKKVKPKIRKGAPPPKIEVPPEVEEILTEGTASDAYVYVLRSGVLRSLDAASGLPPEQALEQLEGVKMNLTFEEIAHRVGMFARASPPRSPTWKQAIGKKAFNGARRSVIGPLNAEITSLKKDVAEQKRIERDFAQLDPNIIERVSEAIDNIKDQRLRDVERVVEKTAELRTRQNTLREKKDWEAAAKVDQEIMTMSNADEQRMLQTNELYIDAINQQFTDPNERIQALKTLEITSKRDVINFIFTARMRGGSRGSALLREIQSPTLNAATKRIRKEINRIQRSKKPPVRQVDVVAMRRWQNEMKQKRTDAQTKLDKYVRDVMKNRTLRVALTSAAKARNMSLQEFLGSPIANADFRRIRAHKSSMSDAEQALLRVQRTQQKIGKIDSEILTLGGKVSQKTRKGKRG